MTDRLEYCPDALPQEVQERLDTRRAILLEREKAVLGMLNRVRLEILALAEEALELASKEVTND